MSIINNFIAEITAQIARLISGINAIWIKSEPCNSQRIFFANHTSNLDALVIWSSLPTNIRKKTRPIAAKDYWNKNRIRYYFAQKIFNVIMVTRPQNKSNTQTNRISSARKELNEIFSCLNKGYSLIIFPEGTRSLSENIGQFKAGLYHIAKKFPNIELVPVYIENLNRVLPKGEFLPVPILSRITFGKPVKILKDEIKGKFLERTRNIILELRGL